MNQKKTFSSDLLWSTAMIEFWGRKIYKKSRLENLNIFSNTYKICYFWVEWKESEESCRNSDLMFAKYIFFA